MSATFWWILGSGLVMSSFALVGAVGLLVEERTLRRFLLPLVALAAGSLLGGAFFHMIPAGVDTLGNTTALWVWVTLGFVTFFCFEQFLHYHHCHSATHDHRHPVGHMILFADTPQLRRWSGGRGSFLGRHPGWDHGLAGCGQSRDPPGAWRLWSSRSRRLESPRGASFQRALRSRVSGRRHVHPIAVPRCGRPLPGPLCGRELHLHCLCGSGPGNQST